MILISGTLYLKGYLVPQENVQKTVPYAAPEPAIIEKRLEIQPKGQDKPQPDAPLPPKPQPPPEPSVPGIEDLTQKALNNFNEGNYETAAALFSELSKYDKRAFVGLGLSYFRLGDYRSSAYFLEKAIGERDVDEFLVLKFLAFTYYKLDDLDLSLKNANSALGIHEDAELRELTKKLERERPAQESFIKEETLHFKVLFDGYEHGSLSRKVLLILEDAYSYIGAQMGYFPSEPVTVILYSGEQFYDVTLMPEWSGGIFDGKIRVPVKGIEESDHEVLRKVLYHEYTHAFVYSIAPNCPTWVNEGLAMYFSGEHQKRIGQVIPLRSLEGRFPQTAAASTTAYGVSYSAVADLIERYGLFSFREFLFALSKGQGIEGAFRSAFFMSYNDFVESWGKS